MKIKQKEDLTYTIKGLTGHDMAVLLTYASHTRLGGNRTANKFAYELLTKFEDEFYDIDEFLDNYEINLSVTDSEDEPAVIELV